jgi:hypothetical protein
MRVWRVAAGSSGDSEEMRRTRSIYSRIIPAGIISREVYKKVVCMVQSFR